MNRILIPLVFAFGTSSLLLMDSAIKGSVILLGAACLAVMLKRDSAAMRHLVWLVAIVAMLVVPVFSVLLPRWQVLPAWAAISQSSPAIETPNRAVELPRSFEAPTAGSPESFVPGEFDSQSKAIDTSHNSEVLEQPRIEVQQDYVGMDRATSDPSWSWMTVLPFLWSIGFGVLILRLMAARWMLWSNEQRANVIAVSGSPNDARKRIKQESDAAIVAAFENAHRQLGIRQRVQLLIDSDRTIPVVWGIVRCRLMLPATARQWSDEQLQSVLLHELAHIKRRDALVQLLTQMACALHWFNPLVWFAAWRLDVERERSCDDLVLASGIKPSDYAAHLLEVVSGLSQARWTQACGLAMARKSSLEGRLTAVLGKDLNRRGVSVTLAGIALLISIGIAVPIAMLRAAQHVETNPEANAMNSEPKDDKSKALFESWKASARTDGKIPGGRIGELATELKTRIVLNPGSQTAVGWEEALKKCDVTRDWSPSEAATLLDEIEVAVPGLAESAMWTNMERRVHFGKKLPDELKDAPWGSPQAQGEQLDASSLALRGLRIAWLLEPKEESYALGGVLKSRVLFHNTGKIPVCFATENWIQSGMHTAKDAAGKEISVWATQRLGERTRMIFRLAPGEYAEVQGHSIGIGSHESATKIRTQQAGAWIEAKPGDLVTFLPGKLHVSFQTWQHNEARKDSKTAWNETIAARVSQEGPWPTSVADRELLIERVTRDLGIQLSTEGSKGELLRDNSSDGLAKLTAQLQAVGASMHFSGELSSGETTFKVTEARPEVAMVIRPADEPQAIMPKQKDARALYEVWQRYARANGDIPGGLIGELAAAVKQFIKYNPTWETVPTLNEILPRLDATHDWKPADAIALLHEVAGIQDSPLGPAPWKGTRDAIRQGEALPEKYADVPWGEEQANGLRAAWVLEPNAAEYRIDTALKARLLVQNRGQVPVMLQVPTFHQGWVKGTDAKGSEVQVSGIEWTTRALLNTVRLAPGEYIEINTPGVGIGPRAGMGPWAGPRVGSNVLAKAGDELTLTHGLVPLDGSEVGVSEDDPHVSGPGWWLAHIKTRLNRELPLPADAAERTRMLDRAVRELFATAPTAEETEAFIADKTPDAIDALAKRLAARTDAVSFSGKLPTVPVKFRVLDADENADKQPRVVLGPGEYPLPSTTATRGNATLKIVGRPVGDRRTNDAQLIFEATEFTGARPPDPHKLEVPDGWRTWAIVCRPSEGFFYLLHKGAVRKIDYSDPGNVTDLPANDLPTEFRDEVKRQLDIAGVSAAQQAEIFEKPAPPAAAPDSKTNANVPAKPSEAGTPKLPKLPDEDYAKTGIHCQKFREEDAKRPGGELMSDVVWTPSSGECPLQIGLRVAQDAKWTIGGQVRVEMVVRNLSGSDVKFSHTGRADNGLSVVAMDKNGKENRGDITAFLGKLGFNHLLLPRSHAVTVKSFMLRFDPDKRDVSEPQVAAFHLPPGDYTLRCKWNDARPEVAHEGEWTGELVCDEHNFTLAAANAAQPPSKSPKTTEQEPITAWGKEVNGLQAGLGFKAVEKRAYHHGETANVVLRVRNVGKDAQEFKHIWAYFVENPPMITDAGGKPVHLPRLEAEGEHGPDSPKISPGKAVELYEWKIELKPETPRLGRNVRVSRLYGTGKFGLQCERIVGPTSANPHDPNPAMSKLATGKLELEIQPVALVQQETPAAPPTASPAALSPTREGPKTEKPKDGPAPTAATGIPSLSRHGAKLRPATEEKLKWGESVNGLRAALVMKPVPDEPDAEDKNDIFLVVQNVTKAEVWLHASDAAPNPRQLIWRDKGVLETVTEVSKPIPSDLRLQAGEVAFFRMTQPPGKRNPGGRSTGSLVEESIRKDLIFSLEGSMEISTAPIGAWSGKLLSGRTEGGTAIPQVPAEAATVFLEVKGKDANGKTVVMMSFEEMQRDEATSTVRTTYSSGGSVGSSLFIVRGACEIAKARGATYFAKLREWNGEDGTWMYLFAFSKNKDIRPLANEHELKIFAVSEYEFLFIDPADANVVKVPDDQYMKSGVPVEELAGEGVTWNDVQNGLSLGYRITSDEWRILGKDVKVELWVQNHGDKDVKLQDNMRADPEFGLRVKLKDAKGEDHNSNFWPEDRPPFGFHRLLPPGHAFKVKEFTISLFLPENDFSHAKGHFFGINPGAYDFHCELELPGFSATGEGGKQLTPAAGEWTGKLTTRGLNVEVIAPDAPAPQPRIESTQDGEQPIKTIPVTSKELSGIWYGATDRTGVVVRFIGRESRIKDTQGTVSGEWVVHVVDGSIAAALEFTDDPKAGVVRITVGLWNDKAKQGFTSSLGSIERGEDGTLYLTIDDNSREPMYLPTKRIPLTFIEDRDEIQRSDVEKMQSLMQSLKPR